MKNISSAAFSDTKPHYELLDGLRGVAALLVVFYHIFEGLSFAAGGTLITVINHGYLAVDFFFILSGFVIGYAYDDRLGKSMSLGNFFKRRLIRLHPMIVMGAVLGVIFYLLQGSVQWDGTHISLSLVMLALLCAMFFILAAPGACYDIRGNGEMFPLNGPSWSLFFEYIGNILYALFIHRLSNKMLALLTVLSGVGLAWFALFDVVGYGMIGVGWTLDGANFLGGLLRMLFPFTLGMLLSRHFKPVKIKGAFWICTAVLLVARTVLRSLYRRKRGHLPERSVRSVLHLPRVPAAGVAGRFRKDYRQTFHPDMPVCRRHLLSALCRPLPRDVPVLLLADRTQILYVRRSVAHGSHRLCRQHLAGLALPETL